jgi:hypothetical protein
MNEIFIVRNWDGAEICAYPTYAAAKKYISKEILEHFLDFKCVFDIEEDLYETNEEYENALKHCLIKCIEKDDFFDEYTIDKIPFMNE